MSYSGSFSLGPSPCGRSSSGHDDDIFGSPRSRSSRSKSRPRLSEPELSYRPLDPAFGSYSHSRPSSRSRRPSISVAHTGVSFVTPGTRDPDYLVPVSSSPASRTSRSPSRYPPSASKSGSLSYTSTGLPVDDRAAAGHGVDHPSVSATPQPLAYSRSTSARTKH